MPSDDDDDADDDLHDIICNLDNVFLFFRVFPLHATSLTSSSSERAEGTREGSRDGKKTSADQASKFPGISTRIASKKAGRVPNHANMCVCVSVKIGRPPK